MSNAKEYGYTDLFEFVVEIYDDDISTTTKIHKAVCALYPCLDVILMENDKIIGPLFLTKAKSD